MSKKGKKAGGGKGGGKTEEERLMLLQQRAAAEEEMAKKKEEVLTLFLKDKLQKEERNTAVNLLKLSDGWRSILRQTRAGELRSDLAVLRQTFHRRLDGLDSIAKTLERDLREAERQSAQVGRAHLQRVGRLRAQQDRRVELVQRRWEDGLQQLASRFRCERKQTCLRSRQQLVEVEDATFTVEQRHQTAMHEIHRLYGEGIAAFQSAHEERKTRLTLEEAEQVKEQQLLRQETLKLCTAEADKLCCLQQESQDLVYQMDVDLEKAKELQDTIIQLRTALSVRKTDNTLVELADSRNQVNRETRALRDQLTRAHTAAGKRLTELTAQSDTAAKKLEAVLAKGQKVLRVAEMCRKLQIEQRNVSSLLPHEEPRPERTGPGTEEPGQEISELQWMTRNINTSVLQREALRKQKDGLSRENLQLRLLLRQHLDAMTLSELDGRHALLTVQRAPTTTVQRDHERRHTVIEAVHAVKHSL